MVGRIVDERPEKKTYTSLDDWENQHPDCLPLVKALVVVDIKLNGSHVDYLSPVVGEYTWGDYTEIKFWDSPVAFAGEHAQSHPVRSVREYFLSDLAKKMASRFRQGYLIEVVGLRDESGRDISSAMPDEEYPKGVYSGEMERRAEFKRLRQETSGFLRRVDAAHKGTRESNLIFIGAY